MSNRLEILAPVGGSEQLLAAVRCGADAVYFGLKDFNARRNADNFSGDKLDESIKYCHDRDVKVYVTINTLVMDKELSAAKESADRAVSAGADGIIVQDLALADYISCHHSVPLIASTQMAVCNVSGARLLKDRGFRRVVLARELSLEEIRKITSEVNIETEVFVHGAHCMSVSGNCYLSSMIGGRSGNRGLCAQPCRLSWQCGECGHSLSLKDLSYVEHIGELAEAGVTSLKIEGRMKRAEYVAAAVTACRDALEGRMPDMDSLRSVFSRSGFTDGYLTGRRDADMFGYRTKEDVVAAKDVLKELSQLYAEENFHKDIDMTFIARRGLEAELSVSLDDRTVSVSGPEPEDAIKLSMDEAYVRRQLEKTGGTVYRLRRLRCVIEPGLMLPASAINKMRRDALDLL